MTRLAIRDFGTALGTGSVLGPAGVIDVTATSSSFACWAKLKSYNGSTIMGLYNTAGTNESYRLTIENSTGKVFVWTVNAAATGALAYRSTNTMPLNTWLRFVVTHNLATSLITIYCNGTLLGSGIGNIPRASSTVSVVGNPNGVTSVNDDIAVWNRELTATEVGQDYQTSIPPTPILWWKFDEGAGSTALDSSGNSYSGTITGGAYTPDVPSKPRRLINANLVRNGDFELSPPFTAATTTSGSWIDGTAAGSTTAPPGQIFNWAATATGSLSAQYDPANANSGTKSMKVSCSSSLATVVNARGTTLSNILENPIVLVPNIAYTFTFYMKTNYTSGSATTGAHAIVSERNAAGTQVATNTSTGILTTTGWTQYTLNFTTSATTLYALIKLEAVGNGGTGTLVLDAWFDDVVLKPTVPLEVR